MTVFNKVKQVLDDVNLLLKDICDQLYNNTGVMTGVNKVFFKNMNKHTICALSSYFFKSHWRKYSFFTTRICWLGFNISQLLFVFFSDSSHRWSILKYLPTRWPAHDEAVQTLQHGLKNILRTPKYIFKDLKRNQIIKKMQHVFF